MDFKQPNNEATPGVNKKAIIIASVIAGVLLVAGVSYGVYYKMSGTSKKVQTTNTPNTVNTNTSNLPVNATDWKTFSDKGLGFEIKYPSNWSYTNEGGIVNFKETGKQYLIEGSESVPVSVSVLDSVGNDTSLDRANKRNRYNGSVKSLTVAGQNAAEVKDYLGMETYVVYSGSVYVVATPNFGEETTDTSIHNVYSEMLKTLKFLDKSSNVSDWQTYKNTRIGFEFEHPRDLRVKENTTKQTNAFGKSFLELKSDGSALNLLIYVNDEGRGFENFITNVSSEEIQIDGVTASLDIADEPASGETEPRRGYFVTFEKNSNNFFLLFSYKKSGEEQDKTIRKIISTFKFETVSKGTLMVYDPKAVASELKSGGFEPLVWYLADKDTKWEEAVKSAKLNTKLEFSEQSKCKVDNNGIVKEEGCLEGKEIRWGYGDRVRIIGENTGGVLNVDVMEIVSSSPVSEW